MEMMQLFITMFPFALFVLSLNVFATSYSSPSETVCSAAVDSLKQLSVKSGNSKMFLGVRLKNILDDEKASNVTSCDSVLQKLESEIRKRGSKMPSLNLTEEQTTALYDYWCDITPECYGSSKLTKRQFTNDQLATHQNGTKPLVTARWFGYQIFIPSKEVTILMMKTGVASGVAAAVGMSYPPAAPFVGPLSIYLMIQSSSFAGLNKQSKGVIITSLWVTPGIFYSQPAAPYYTSLPEFSQQNLN